MKKLNKITIAFFILFLSVQGIKAQTKSNFIKGKSVHKPTRLDTLNKMISDTLKAQERIKKKMIDTMAFANAQNDKRKALTANSQSAWNTPEVKKLSDSIDLALNANSDLLNQSRNIDVAVQNLKFQIIQIKGVTNKKTGVKEMPVNYDKKSGTITF